MPRRKNIIITGANGGFARPLMKRFAQPENRIYATCREENRQELIDNIEEDDLKSTGVDIQMNFADMRDEPSLHTAANAMSVYKFDVLINNAGILATDDDPDMSAEIRSQQRKDLMQVNYFGPMYFTDCLLPKARNGATIINICSDANLYGRGHLESYSASKGAVYSSTLSLAKRYENALNIYPVLPGWTRTKMGGLDKVQAMRPEYVADRLYDIATGNTDAPEGTKVFGIGPVYEREKHPGFYNFPYPKDEPVYD